MDNSRVENGRRNIVSSAINNIINILLPFFLRTIMIYYLGELYLGLNGLFASILQVLSLAELGFGSAMIFSMYKPISENNVEEVCALLNLYKFIYKILGLVILFCGIIISPFLPNLIRGDVPQDINIYVIYFINLGNTVLSYFLFAYKASLLEALQRLDIISNISSLTKIIFNLFQLFSIVLFRNYYLYCILVPATTICNNCIICYITRKKFPQFICRGNVQPAVKKEIRRKVSGLFVYKLCAICRNSFDSIVISSALGLIMLAKYQNYYYILTSVSSFMLIITNSITAGVGNSIISESKEKNYKDFNKILLLYMWISGWFTICLGGMYQPFMEFWVGKRLTLNNSEMLMFCLYFFCLRMGDVCFMYRQAAGLWWEDRYRPIVESACNLFLDIILVKYYGVVGVLLATIVTIFGINTIWGSKVLYKHYFTEYENCEYIARLLFFLIMTICSGYVSMLVIKYVDINGKMGIVVAGIICTVIPNILYWLAYRNLPEYAGAKELMLAFRKVGIR